MDGFNSLAHDIRATEMKQNILRLGMGVVDQCPIPCYPMSHIPGRTAGVPTPDTRQEHTQAVLQTWISDRFIGNGNQAHTACSAFASVFIRELKHV